jgi:hypothetical protein
MDKHCTQELSFSQPLVSKYRKLNKPSQQTYKLEAIL